ncbi:olfactory receptor 1G1 [Xenopus laevis]|uniref:Olfactory receptor n=2 Tax=Xenopus laevis TaxID=8355 RepID=A0A974C195_XENLA|nr:olfactory receptor 1G1 [Xenopus laevis]OCT64631.1 hypothetical protein XELAEV_18045730mg [Xenopus laevis]
MKNQTIFYEFVLSSVSDLPSLQLPIFLLFFLIYMLTLIGNLLIFLLIVNDSHLHTPMYFFLGTLACLDMSFSSVTVPRVLFDFLTKNRILSVQACITQIYFFVWFAASEISVLAVMSYDRYIAICLPLHYMKIMSWKRCAHLVSGTLIFGAVYSLVHTLLLTKLNFCRSNILHSFLCDLPQLLQISCSDTFINLLIIFLLGILFGIVILGVTFYPYITIITTVLKIPSIQMRSKAFSTCSSHLTVVFMFYATISFNYFCSTATDHFTKDSGAAIYYAVLTPFLNPLIYSLRNQELKASLRRALKKVILIAYD